MNEVDFFRGIEGEEQQGTDLVSGAEHFVRLKVQAGQQTQPQYPDLELEKKAKIFGSREVHEKAKEQPTGYLKAMLTGALLGGGTGAAGNLATSMSHPGTHMAIGGGLGALAGAGVGAMMAHHDKKDIETAKMLMKHHGQEKDADLMGSLAIANPTKGGPGGCPNCGRAMVKEACPCGYSKTKMAYEIQPSSRPDIPKGDFAQPNKEEAGHEGKYPIPDRQHARSALGFAKMHHDSGALAAVRHKIEQKYPDMLHGEGEHEKNATLKRILEKARLGEQEKTAAFAGAKAALKDILKKNPTARAALLGGVVGAVPNAAMGAATAPPGHRKQEALRMGLTGGMVGAGGGALYHHLNTKIASDWNKNMLTATTGLGALAGGVGTYLASRPQKDTGKGKAEEELEGMVEANKKIPERGLLHKLKNRETENAHGFAKAFREHPLKASLLGALMGGASGYGIGQLSGAIARHRGGH